MPYKMTAKERGALNQAHIREVLDEPKRKAAERQFARDHAGDTDEELYILLREMKRKQGKNLKPVKTVGVQYFEERLGPWTDVMGRITASWKPSARKRSAFPPQNGSCCAPCASFPAGM